MSQVKAPPTPTPVQPPHATSHGQAQALSPPSRITTRRSSRSPHSTIATNNSKDTTQDSSSATEEVVTSPESTNGVTTRSRSMDTQQTKDTSNPPDPNQTDTNTKKKRTTASKPIPSRKRSAKQSSASPTTPIPSSVPTLRASKTSARATKRIEAPASRASVRRKRKEPSDGHVPEVDIEHKRQRLSELDEFEKSILDGTHPEYQQHMNNIQEKRQKKIAVAESLYKFQVQNCQSAFEAVKKAALDRFYEQKRNLRLKMIQEIQTKIKLLEQEYNVMQDYETYSSDDEDRQIPLTEWVPPSRHASIYSEPIGLQQQEIDSDLAIARRRPAPARKPTP